MARTLTEFKYVNMTLQSASPSSPFRSAFLYIDNQLDGIMFKTSLHTTPRHGSVTYPVGHSFTSSPDLGHVDGPPGMILEFDCHMGAANHRVNLKPAYLWRDRVGEYLGRDYHGRSIHLTPMKKYAFKQVKEYQFKCPLNGRQRYLETWEHTHTWVRTSGGGHGWLTDEEIALFRGWKDVEIPSDVWESCREITFSYEAAGSAASEHDGDGEDQRTTARVLLHHAAAAMRTIRDRYGLDHDEENQDEGAPDDAGPPLHPVDGMRSGEVSSSADELQGSGAAQGQVQEDSQDGGLKFRKKFRKLIVSQD